MPSHTQFGMHLAHHCLNLLHQLINTFAQIKVHKYAAGVLKVKILVSIDSEMPKRNAIL